MRRKNLVKGVIVPPGAAIIISMYVIVNGQPVKTGKKFFQFTTEVNLKNQWCRLIRRVDEEDCFLRCIN